MNNLRQVIYKRLQRAGQLNTQWAALVLAACDGNDALEAVLRGGVAAAKRPAAGDPIGRTSAYLTSLTVQGFRGIGEKQSLSFRPVLASRVRSE